MTLNKIQIVYNGWVLLILGFNFISVEKMYLNIVVQNKYFYKRVVIVLGIKLLEISFGNLLNEKQGGYGIYCGYFKTIIVCSIINKIIINLIFKLKKINLVEVNLIIINLEKNLVKYLEKILIKKWILNIMY